MGKERINLQDGDYIVLHFDKFRGSALTVTTPNFTAKAPVGMTIYLVTPRMWRKLLAWEYKPCKQCDGAIGKTVYASHNGICSFCAASTGKE